MAAYSRHPGRFSIVLAPQILLLTQPLHEHVPLANYVRKVKKLAIYLLVCLCGTSNSVRILWLGHELSTCHPLVPGTPGQIAPAATGASF